MQPKMYDCELYSERCVSTCFYRRIYIAFIDLKIQLAGCTCLYDAFWWFGRCACWFLYEQAAQSRSSWPEVKNAIEKSGRFSKKKNTRGKLMIVDSKKLFCYLAYLLVVQAHKARKNYPIRAAKLHGEWTKTMAQPWRNGAKPDKVHALENSSLNRTMSIFRLNPLLYIPTLRPIVQSCTNCRAATLYIRIMLTYLVT